MPDNASVKEGASAQAAGDSAPSTSGRMMWEKDADFRVSDIFFWRDAPDWYFKTCMAAGMGFSYSTLRCYMNRHELEVFMPPRSAVLPAPLQQGYRNSQALKYGFLKVGRETTTVAGAAALFYASAYYLGEHRGVHSWENFAVSGAVASLGVGAWLIRPLHPRIAFFGMLGGAALGAGSAALTEALGFPHWREGHDFEGWWFGSMVNLKANRAAAAKAAAADVATVQG